MRMGREMRHAGRNGSAHAYAAAGTRAPVDRGGAHAPHARSVIQARKRQPAREEPSDRGNHRLGRPGSAGLPRRCRSSLPSMTNAHDVIAAYWAAANARDWTAFGALLADDVVYRGPQTREQVRGREAYVRFNVEGFAYDWHLTVQQIVGEGQHAASWVEFTGPEGTQPGLCFFDLGANGQITRITDFWPDPYELPAPRAHLVERY